MLQIFYIFRSFREKKPTALNSYDLKLAILAQPVDYISHMSLTEGTGLLFEYKWLL